MKNASRIRLIIQAMVRRISVSGVLVIMVVILFLSSSYPGTAKTINISHQEDNLESLIGLLAVIEVFNPIGDATVNRLQPNTNFGNGVSLVTDDADFAKDLRPFLQFDLSSIPANSLINSAQLELYLRDNGNDDPNPNASWTVEIFPVTTPWDADTITWNNQPNISSLLEASITVSTEGIFYSWNITALVSNWVDGSVANNGISLNGETSCLGCALTFDSSEATFKPRLIVDYVPQVSTTITPGSGGVLTYTDPQGNSTIVSVPPGAVTENTTLVFIVDVAGTNFPPNFNFAGQAFALNAEQNGFPQPGFSFNEPVTVTINYSDADVAGLEENTLKLYYFNTIDDTWEDAATTCNPISMYTRQPNQNRITVTICHLTDFALFQPDLKPIYLPLIFK